MTRTPNSNINQLRNFIFEKSNKEYSKQTINGLFRSILEPLIETKGEDAFVFLRLRNTGEIKNIVKRLTFSSAKIYSFNDNLSDENIMNIEQENIWGSVEFVIVLSSRYSVSMIWDYETSQNQDMSELCVLYNTRSIVDIAKIVFSNSKVDFSEYLKKFQPDRRENTALNSSIMKLADRIEDLNKEIKINSISQEEFSQSEKHLENYEMANENIRFICHEIKNHLSIVNLYSRIIQKRFQKMTLDDEVQTSLNGAITNIQTSSGTIANLLNDLKCFSKPVLEETLVGEIVRNVIELTNARAKEKQTELKCSGDENISVMADAMKFQNILINLVYNAIDAIKMQGSVEIKWSKQGTYAQILVIDNGSGISDEVKDKIFEMNFTTKAHGNGLGLPICKTLVKEQNGELNLLMTGKKGTVFEILLPLS